MEIEARNLGIVPFEEALAQQYRIRGQVISGTASHTLIFCQHPPTITLGSRANPDNIIHYDSLIEKGINLAPKVDRGGDVTFHGPGQLMGYFIFDLRLLGRDIGRFLNAIELSLLRTVSFFGIPAATRQGLRGIWVGEKKIASIGVGIKKWVSMHGYGLNVSTDLSYFDLIKPCGLDIRMTSLSREANKPIEMKDVILRATQDICSVFKLEEAELHAL